LNVSGPQQTDPSANEAPSAIGRRIVISPRARPTKPRAKRAYRDQAARAKSPNLSIALGVIRFGGFLGEIADAGDKASA
jgi:hypothetical protein